MQDFTALNVAKKCIDLLEEEIEVSKAANISLANELEETKKKLEIAKEGLRELAKALQSVTVNKLVYDILQKIEGE